MNDEQMQPLLEAWYSDREVAPGDVREGVAQVMVHVPQTPQQGRWWPLPMFDRPAPIPPTNGRQPARGFTMFSALKFVAAAAIVALFGGFLLTGILTTQQGDEMAPAAVTESPSPVMTEDLLSGMVTEEVEPDVERIISDGAGHDLDETIPEATATRIGGIAIASDGTVWLTITSEFDDNSSNVNANDEGSHIWALGQPGTYTHEHGLPARRGAVYEDLVILADGTLLAIGDHVLRLDDDRFVLDDGPMLRRTADGGLLLLMGGADLANLLPEGEVALSKGEVASMRDLQVISEPASHGHWLGVGDHGRWSVGDQRCYLEGEDEASLEGVTCGWGWGPFNTYLTGTPIHQLAAAPDGSVWAVGEYDGDPGLYRITPPPAE